MDALRIIAYLAIYIAYQSLFVAVAGIAVGFYYGFKAGDVAGIENIPDYYVTWAMAIGMFMAAVVGIVTYMLMGAVKFRKGFFSAVPVRALFFSVIIIFFSILALNLGVSYLELPDTLEEEFDGLSHNVVGILSISLVVPILEEVLFRGAIQGRLMRQYRSPWVAIIIASLIFGIIHFNPIQTVYATFLGIVFGWIYYRTRSLLPVILGHVFNNSFATLTTLMVEETAPRPEVEVSKWASLPFFVVFASLAIFFAYRLHRALPKVCKPWHEIGEELPANVTDEVPTNVADEVADVKEC